MELILNTNYYYSNFILVTHLKLAQLIVWCHSICENVTLKKKTILVLPEADRSMVFLKEREAGIKLNKNVDYQDSWKRG